MPIKLPKALAEAIAEMLGTFILVFIGLGSVAIKVLTQNNDLLPVAVGFGCGIFIGHLIAAPISGAHLNPGFTLTMVTLKKLNWKKMFHYIGAQYLGAFLASAFVFGIYYESIDELNNAYPDDKAKVSGQILTTFPRDNVNAVTAICDELFPCAVLMMAILAILDENGLNMSKSMQPFAMAVAMIGINVSFSLNCGPTLNPARDLGPRVFTILAGYGFDCFKPLSYCYWWIIGIFAPHVGFLVGGWIYYLLFENYNNNNKDAKKNEKKNSDFEKGNDENKNNKESASDKKEDKNLNKKEDSDSE